MVQSPPFVGRVSTCRLLDGLIDASGGGSASVVLGEPGVTVHEEGLRLGGCSALWRLRGAGIAVVTSDQGRLALRDDVLVDLDAVNDWAGRVIAGCAGPAELTLPEHAFEALNLLTGWYDDWIIMQRERSGSGCCTPWRSSVPGCPPAVGISRRSR